MPRTELLRLFMLSSTSLHNESPWIYTFNRKRQFLSGYPLPSPHLPPLPFSRAVQEYKPDSLSADPIKVGLRSRLTLGSRRIAKKPLHLRRRGFSPLFAFTTTSICTGARSTGRHRPASVHAPRLPTGSQPEVVPLGIGTRLSPVHFPGLFSRSMNFYVLIRG